MKHNVLLNNIMKMVAITVTILSIDNFFVLVLFLEISRGFIQSLWTLKMRTRKK
jgi:hypothetical protein